MMPIPSRLRPTPCALLLALALSPGAGAGPQAGTGADDDDLGSQPLKEPSAADLGVDTGPPPEAASTTRPRSPRPSSPPAPTTPSPTTSSATSTASSTAAATTPEQQLLDALHDLDDADPKALEKRVEAAATLWIPDPVISATPKLRPLQRLVRARLAVLQRRFDEADAALREAGGALDAVAIEGHEARRLREAVRFLRAAVVEGRARPILFEQGCGRPLGIRRLARDEAERRQQRLDDVTSRYAAIAAGHDRFWGRRAAFAAARLSEDVARLALAAPDYRTVILPPPYSIESIDSQALVEPTLGTWLGGLRRAYGEILGAIDARSPDPALADRVRLQAAELARLELKGVGEAVQNPWRKDFHPGLVRVARRAERVDATGRFSPVDNATAIERMTAAIAGGPATVDGAFGIAGLALLQPEAVPLEPIISALSSTEERVVVAGMIAAERIVKGKNGAERAVALREPLLAATGRAFAAKDAARVPFSTLQSTLYDPVERGLLSLLSLARADRSVLDVVVADERLPVVERAWLAAEVADSRLAERYDRWAWDKDERVAALAVWGGVSSRGRKFAGYLLRPGDAGLVGCVSRALTE